MGFIVSFATRWSDFDPNSHMRHTAYNDYAAESRVRLFMEYGLSLTELNLMNIGPILFKEETNFFKEILPGDDIHVEVFLKGASARGERFKMLHKIFRRDQKLAAEIQIYGAWLDLKTRKLAVPPSIIMKVFSELPKTEQFEKILIQKK